MHMPVKPAFNPLYQQVKESLLRRIAAGEWAPGSFLPSEPVLAEEYGVSHGTLRKALNDLGVRNFKYLPYDPVFPDYGPPTPAQLSCCIDVLEHVEEHCLPAILADLKAITKRVGFFTIHTGPAAKTLSDGRNAHILQRPSSWWLPRLCEHFEIVQLAPAPGGFWMLVEPRKTLNA